MSGTRAISFTRAFDGFDPRGRDPVQPRFHIEAIPDELATARQGRPIYREEERVQFLLPGSPNQPVFRVNDEHRQRWPEQYAAFKRGQEWSAEGTPLEQWPGLTKAMVLELKALQIHTVEQCATLTDTACQAIKMAGYQLRERAKAYLDDAARESLVAQLERLNDDKDSRIASLERQVAEQGAIMQRLYEQQVAAGDRQHPLATHVPAASDPLSQGAPIAAPIAHDPGAQSSLASLPPLRRRGGKEAA